MWEVIENLAGYGVIVVLVLAMAIGVAGQIRDEWKIFKNRKP